MKELFDIKLSHKIPQIQINNINGLNTLADSDTDKIEALNTYFSPSSTIDDTNVTLSNMYSLCNNNLSNIIIEEQEISDIITILPVNKAIVPDCFSHKMLKPTESTIVKPLTLSFNRSLSEKMFPSLWKIAHVIDLSRYYRVLVKLCRELSSNMYTTIFIAMVCFIDTKLVCCQDNLSQRCPKY